VDRETRLAWLVDHFNRPRHKGALADADASVPGGNPGCGDIITLHLKAEPGENRVAAVSFEGVGCTLSQAAASILAERINKDRPSFEEVLEYPQEQMIDLLGRDIAEARPGCALLALGTLKGAVKTVEMNRKLRAAGHTEAQIAELRRAAP
jgi:nitrogen fixation NifU-like protein